MPFSLFGRLVWGAVMPFLVLAVVSLTSHHPETVRAAYIAMILPTGLRLLHMQPTSAAAAAAVAGPLTRVNLADVRMQLVADAGTAVFVLLAATVLSIYGLFSRDREMVTVVDEVAKPE